MPANEHAARIDLGEQVQESEPITPDDLRPPEDEIEEAEEESGGAVPSTNGATAVETTAETPAERRHNRLTAWALGAIALPGATRKARQNDRAVREHTQAAESHRQGGEVERRRVGVIRRRDVEATQPTVGGQAETVNSLLAVVNTLGPTRRGEAASEVRRIIYGLTDRRHGEGAATAARERGQVRYEEQPDSALNPANIMALREHYVGQLIRRREQTAREIGRAWPRAPQNEDEMRSQSPADRARLQYLTGVTERRAWLALRDHGIRALSPGQAAAYLHVTPEAWQAYLYGAPSPVPEEVLDQVNLMIRLDAAGLLENVNRKPEKRQPGDQASPLNLLLPANAAELKAEAEQSIGAKLDKVVGDEEQEARRLDSQPSVSKLRAVAAFDDDTLMDVGLPGLRRFVQDIELERGHIASAGKLTPPHASRYEDALRRLDTMIVELRRREDEAAEAAVRQNEQLAADAALRANSKPTEE